MRRVILMRHGKTVASVPAGDHARHLTPRGIAEATEAGRILSPRGTPDFALVSDARRTRETFDRVVEAVGRDIPHRFDRRLYGASTDQILAVLAEAPEEAAAVLVIGHNPGIGELARRLSGQSPKRRELDDHFPTSAFASIALKAPDWRGAGLGGTLETFTVPGEA